MGMGSAHTAMKQELLVRYLDAWLPAALHGHRRVCLLCATASTELLGCAVTVLTELADLLGGHELTLVTSLPLTAPSGVAVAPTWSAKLGLPFAFVDQETDLLEAVCRTKGAEVLAFLPEPYELGLPLGCVADLVARDGSHETLNFGTSSERALEKFKEELWAIDEFAGVQLRDPDDPELLDIALQPHLGPLRRMLVRRLAATGPTAVLDLRTWTLQHTVYRAADATRALQAMVAAGDVHREPVAGRLTPTTVIVPV
jgi:hypothetical protein